MAEVLQTLKYQSQFSWDMPEIDSSVEIYIRNLTEKCQAIEEEHQFQWTRFVPSLILSYEFCEKMKDYTQALEHIRWCQDHWNNLQLECLEPLFQSLREVIAHVILATKAHILLAAGKVDLAQKEADLLSRYPYGDVTRLSSTKNRAGLQGLKAAVYLQHQGKGSSRALEAAKEARALDPDQAEWWFIIGLSLGRIRRVNTRRWLWVISSEEVEAIEKAFSLQRDASYTVHLAQVYADYSNQLFGKKKYEKAKTYADKATSRYREALQLRPNCANLKARVARGMIRILCKEAMDKPFIKNLLDEVVRTSPNRAMAYVDLGFYYSQVEKDIEKAIFNNQKAYELGSCKSIMFLSQLKWKAGLEDQIIADVEEGLVRYHAEEDQAMLYSHLGACHVLIHDDWEAAIPCFRKSLDLDPSAVQMKRFKGFSGKDVNLLKLITNHLHFNGADTNQEMTESFLSEVAKLKPQQIQFSDKNVFLIWKKKLENKKHAEVKNHGQGKVELQE